ncbi:hypothetical protein ACFLRM_04850 [Acidobacteriota bacterium]
MRIKSIIKILPILPFFLVSSISNLSAQGHFELGFHYGSWSIDVAGSLIEEEISNGLEEELRDEFLAEIQQDHPDLFERSYDQNVEFDSGGHNYGFEMRWYPNGKGGSFSLGLSVEKTSMRVSLTDVSSRLELSDGSIFNAASDAEFTLSPLAFLLSFRWDIKPASWKVRPYITFGFGAAAISSVDTGEISYSYSGDLVIAGENPEHYEDQETKTIKELREEIEEDEGEEVFLDIPVIPFLQLNIGLKGEVAENLFLLVDAGIWNGFLLRGGASYRF